MKRLFQVSMLLVAAMEASAQKGVVTVTGHVTGDTKGRNNIYFYSSGSALDSVAISNGQFKVALPYTGPYTELFYTEYELIGDNGMRRGYRPFPMLIDQPGAITVNMNIADGFYKSELTGAPSATLFASFLKEQGEVYTKVTNELDKIYGPSKSNGMMRSGGHGTDPRSVSRDSLTQIYMGDMIQSFVKRHPDDFVSVYVLNGSGKSLPAEQMEKAYSLLSEKSKNSETGKKVAAYVYGLKNAGTGGQVKNFVLTDPNGNSYDFSRLKGKYVWVDFWASWCGPCKKAFPAMRDLYTKYKSDKFELVGISTDETKAPWLKAVDQFKNPWPQLWDNKAVANEFAVAAYPTGFLIDPDGKIIVKEVGFDPEAKDGIAKKLEEIFSK